MKAYIIKIELNDSKPLIWRKVVLPAGGTFHRLHETIMRVTNFRGKEPELRGHLYRFDLKEENSFVTNDLNKIDEHRDFQNNLDYYEERLKETEEKFRHFEKSFQNEMKKKALFPSKVKFDDYLEKYGEIEYLYDFGDSWTFRITLMEIVEDYYFGYPMLLDGEGDAPPENVGGMDMFYEFLEAYNDPSHENHDDALEVVKMNVFWPYNEDHMNDLLKRLKYRKTEWDKISHENFIVIKDKYYKVRQ